MFSKYWRIHILKFLSENILASTTYTVSPDTFWVKIEKYKFLSLTDFCRRFDLLIWKVFLITQSVSNLSDTCNFRQFILNILFYFYYLFCAGQYNHLKKLGNSKPLKNYLSNLIYHFFIQSPLDAFNLIC